MKNRVSHRLLVTINAVPAGLSIVMMWPMLVDLATISGQNMPFLYPVPLYGLVAGVVGMMVFDQLHGVKTRRAVLVVFWLASFAPGALVAFGALVQPGGFALGKTLLVAVLAIVATFHTRLMVASVPQLPERIQGRKVYRAAM